MCTVSILEKANALLGVVGRLINLLTFDCVDLSSSSVKESVDPLMIILEYKLISRIDPRYHTELRKCLKATIRDQGAFPGEVNLDGLTIKVYYKRRNDPAWSPDDSNQS